jgi:hypothetical protein
MAEQIEIGGTDPADLSDIELVSEPSSSSELSQVVAQVAIATKEFQNMVVDTLNDMLSASYDFDYQVGTTYHLPEPVDPVVYGIAGPVDLSSSSAVSMPAFSGQAPTMTEPTITTGDPPDMNIDLPNIHIPEAPDTDIPGFNLTAPVIAAPDIPASLEYALPMMPRLSDITIPEPPAYNIVEFDAEAPLMDLTPPEGELVWSEDGYSSRLSTLLDGRLRADIANSLSTGIRPATQQTIIARGRTRQATDNARLIAQADFFPPEVLSSLPPRCQALPRKPKSGSPRPKRTWTMTFLSRKPSLPRRTSTLSKVPPSIGRRFYPNIIAKQRPVFCWPPKPLLNR